MLIRISARPQPGASASPTLAADFGREGGTIGRAANNTLVLDDPARTVSRVHAQVICRDGKWVIVDRGSNPTQINGRPIGAGNEAAIRPGDHLQVGSYELRVSAATAGAAAGGVQGGATAPAPMEASDDDPFAHLLDGLGAPAEAPAAPPPSAPDPTAGLFPDPLGAAPAAAGGSDPFSDLSPPGRAPASGDFSDLVGSQGDGAESIDALFGLGEPVGNDPLADPLLQPNTASSTDPLAALSSQAVPTPEARSDHVPVDAFGFVPPAAHAPPSPLPVDPPASTGTAPAAPAESVDPFAGLGQEPPAPPAQPGAAADDPFAGLDLGASLVAGGAAPVEAAPEPPAAGAGDTGPDIVAPELPLPGAAPAPPADAAVPPAAPQPPPATPRAPAPAARAAGGAASDDELLAAFLRGVGTLQKPLDMLTPELMQRMGQMLRTATEGTLQLLHTRQEFKQEVRAQVTMIAAQANNPLKFSPTVEVALSHLLGEQVRGFMAAEDAMRDAYQDLRAHEFGVMVGMRAALDHVIKQFEPEALEENIATRSRLDAIFSANRKARLWDQFVKLYAEIAREAEDDFHSLFGKAFLRAYEEQMQRLKSAEQGGPTDAN